MSLCPNCAKLVSKYRILLSIKCRKLLFVIVFWTYINQKLISGQCNCIFRLLATFYDGIPSTRLHSVLNSLLMSQIYQRMPGHKKCAENWHDSFNSSELHRNMIQDKSKPFCQYNRTHACIHVNIVFCPLRPKIPSKYFCVRFSKTNVSDSWCAICQEIVALPKICKVSWTLSFFRCKSWPVLDTVCPPGLMNWKVGWQEYKISFCFVWWPWKRPI